MPKNENRKKVQEPVNECPLLAKGAIMAEVEAAKPRGTVKTKVTDVQVFASGPSAPDKPKKTNSSGRADFQELTVGDYTVRVELPGKMADYYEDVPAAQSKPVTAGKTTVYFFRLMAVYVEYFVKYPNGKAAEGFDFVLRVLKASGTEWEEQQKGKIGKAKVSEDFVPKGRYRLEVKYVHEAKWGAAEAVVGEPIDMSALAPGSDSGAAGTFDIFDARTLEAAIDTVSA